jgi:hypothetical protein
MDGAELPKVASDAADRGVAAKVGENIAGVAGGKLQKVSARRSLIGLSNGWVPS